MAKPRPAPAKKASDPMTLMNLTAGKWVSQAIAVVAELGIADLLKDGPRTAADIARTANASAAMRDSQGTRARGARGETFGTASEPVSRLLTMSLPCPFSSTSRRCQNLQRCSTRR
jgi:hypothetical protein